MRKLTLMLLTVMLLAIFPLSANTYTYLSPVYANATVQVGLTAVWAGPYNIEDTGTLIEYEADCISGASETIPSSWLASLDLISDYSSSTPPTTIPPASSTTFVGGAGATTMDLEEMAWLDEQISSFPTNNPVIEAIQEAIWYLAGVGGGSNSTTDISAGVANTAPSYWVTQAGNQSAAILGALSSSELLVPTTAGASQVFLIPVTTTTTTTPEPPALSLIGLALLGLGILLKRKVAA